MNTLYKHAIGYVIRSKRLEKRMTLRDVGGAVPMSISYLSELERGQKEVASEMLDLISRTLGVTAGEMILEAAYVLLDWEQQEREKEQQAVELLDATYI